MSSEQGVRGLAWLHSQVPAVIKGDSHEIIFDAGRAQGAKEMLDRITQMLAAAPDAPKEIESGNDLFNTR